MIKIKPQVQVLISMIFFVCILATCSDVGEKSSESALYGESWREGKELFYINCSPCHVPRNKDEIFEGYLQRGRDLLPSERLKGLHMTLIDSNHINKNITIGNPEQEQVKLLLEYIETPQRRETVE